MNARAPTTFLVAAELTTRQDNSGMAGSAPAHARVKSLDASRISGNVSPSVSSAPAPAQAHPRKHPCKQMSLIRPRIPRLHIPMHAACSIVPESLSRPTPMANIFSELSMRVATRVAPLLLIRIVVILFLLHIFAVSIRMSRFAKAREGERTSCARSSNIFISNLPLFPLRGACVRSYGRMRRWSSLHELFEIRGAVLARG